MSVIDVENTVAGKWGRIFMGSRVSDLSSISNAPSNNWTAKDEQEYLERVRAKAEEKARDILALAHAEVQAIKEAAQAEGYAAGLDAANEELEILRGSMGDAVSVVLSTIEGQSKNIFDSWRTDLTELLIIAVEKCVGIVLAEDKREVLKALYCDAVKQLENAKEITVRVNPEDEIAVTDIIGFSQDKFSDIQSWKVKSDPSISTGGLLVESRSSLADNSIESRMRALNIAMETLHLPDF